MAGREGRCYHIRKRKVPSFAEDNVWICTIPRKSPRSQLQYHRTQRRAQLTNTLWSPLLTCLISSFPTACESVADTVFNAVWTLGCRPFMNSQRSACICSEEERDEL